MQVALLILINYCSSVPLIPWSGVWESDMPSAEKGGSRYRKIVTTGVIEPLLISPDRNSPATSPFFSPGCNGESLHLQPPICRHESCGVQPRVHRTATGIVSTCNPGACTMHVTQIMRQKCGTCCQRSVSCAELSGAERSAWCNGSCLAQLHNKGISV